MVLFEIFKKFLSSQTLGTAACPPYHLAVVIGGMSAEMTLKTVKLASTRYLDHLPTEGNEFGQAIRDPNLEAEILQLTRKTGEREGSAFGFVALCSLSYDAGHDEILPSLHLSFDVAILSTQKSLQAMGSALRLPLVFHSRAQHRH